MSYSHTLSITADLAKVQAAASNLGSYTDAASAIASDPQAYLGNLGISIDDDTAAAVKARFAQRSATPAPAAIVHIDA